MKLKKMLAVVSALCMMCAVVPVLPDSVLQIPSVSVNAFEGDTVVEKTEIMLLNNINISKTNNHNALYEENILSSGYQRTIYQNAQGKYYAVIQGEGGYMPLFPDYIDIQIEEETISVPVREIFVSDVKILVLPDTVTRIGRYHTESDNGINAKTVFRKSDPVFIEGLKTLKAFDGKYCIEKDENGNSIDVWENMINEFTQHASLPENLKQIDAFLFHQAGSSTDSPSEFTELTIPESVTEIGEGAFYNCTTLESVTVNAKITRLEKETFAGCKALTSVKFSDTLTSIGEEAFGKSDFPTCSSLTTINIPKNVKEIGKNAFADSGLEKIYIWNKECSIYDEDEENNNTETLSGGIYGSNENKTIFGYKNSTAQTYAEKYNYSFKVFGDADDSGEVDILDVITFNKAVLGKETLTETQLNAIDFNGNGKPDSEEALMLMKYIVGLIDSFTE